MSDVARRILDNPFAAFGIPTECRNLTEVAAST